MSENKNLPSSQEKEPLRTESHASLINFEMSSLPAETRAELTKQAAEVHLHLQKKAGELGIDNQAMHTRLGNIVDSVTEAVNDGASATVTGVYRDTMGSTEAIIGNTEAAQQGKLTSGQRGERDLTLWYFLIAAGVIVIIAAMMLKG